MKQISTSNNNLTMVKNRKSLGGWEIASAIHCMLFAWQYGLLFTYVCRFVFGSVGYITENFFPYQALSAILTILKNAPYWVYAPVFCLLCLHCGRTKIKESRTILSLILLLSFAHQAMITERLMIFFYIPCIIGTILPFLVHRPKTYLFDWPLCKKQAECPFNIFVLFVTIVVSAGICGVLSIPELFNIHLFSIIAVLFKMEFWENFTEYYDLAYTQISKILSKGK